MIIVGVAALIGLPIGIGTGLYLAEYGSGRFGWIVRFVADVLNGTPSIVVGIFAWTWLVRPMGHFSALAGSVALAVLMVPMIARTTEEMVRLVPHSLREAALALGYPRWRTSLRIVARTALAGILTSCLVGIARIIKGRSAFHVEGHNAAHHLDVANQAVVPIAATAGSQGRNANGHVVDNLTDTIG